MPYSGYPIVGADIARTKKNFYLPLLRSKPTTLNQECSKHLPSLSALRSNELSCSKMKWWAIYKNFPGNAIVRLPHCRSGDSQGQETFLAPSANKQTRNYKARWCSIHHPHLSLSTPRSKGLRKVSEVKIRAGSQKLPEWFSDLPSKKSQQLPSHEEVVELLKLS